MKRKRITSRTVSEESNSVIFTFDQAYEYFLSSKKAEGLRKPTLIVIMSILISLRIG